ncbi:MAG: GyrI-like domain-containing protein [Bacteroidota bacterium]
MAEKYEWRKKAKAYYLPKTQAEIVDIPEFQFATIKGQGNPNDPAFGDYIQALYALSYGIKMTLKKMDNPPKGYQDYTVFPLEGVWDITEEAKETMKDELDKDQLVFHLMIRQPDYIDQTFFEEIKAQTLSKKSDIHLLEKVQFERIQEGKCIQMLHIGPYDDEPASFERMEAFANEQGVERASKIHREIYLSDFRKVPKEKLKTVLRFQLR